MTAEEKQLLLIDLCARLPYRVKVQIKSKYTDDEYITVFNSDLMHLIGVKSVKPYLRPLSSMTEEEKNELRKLCEEDLSEYAKFIRDGHGLSRDGLYMFYPLRQLDFLNSHHFDYRGLIPMGLALEASADMYHNTNLDVVDTVDDIIYDIDSDNVEVIYKSGKITIHNIESLKLISSDEREFGTEHDYLIEPNIHVVFYPEGHISTFYFDE